MAVSLIDFRNQFPEFAKLDDSHVQAHLDAADTVLDSAINSSLYDQLVCWYAADSLASTPWGYNARLSQPGQPSAYKMKYDELLGRSARRGVVVYGPGTVT